jgi:hypothetical protein
VKRLGEEAPTKIMLAAALVIPFAVIERFGKIDVLGIAAAVTYGFIAAGIFRGLVYPGTWLPDDDR